MPKCPKCGCAQVKKTEDDITEDGAEMFQFECLKCGYTWENEE